MSQSLLEGISMGLLLSLLIGPVFFALISSSMQHGFRYAAVLALGIFVSDSLYGFLTYFGISFLANTTLFEEVLGYVGGAILVGFGVSSLMKRQKPDANSKALNPPVARRRNAFAKGFSINGINPFVLLFWISIASLVSLRDDWTSIQTFFYYSGILLTVLCTDLAKAFVAKQLSRFVTPKILGLLNKGVGGALIFYGLRMIYLTYQV
ncbi:LysE family transporter [Algoriphagus jejuensis]|uniref:LysE family transporter n=1 Tax=Algoriphagus jejuensis TaxID=419934 RepID=A0ABP3YIT5_9BACT